MKRKHIQKAICKDPYKCALVLALQDAIPNSSVRIDPGYYCSHLLIRTVSNDIVETGYIHNIKLDLSPSTQLWVNAFDVGFKLAPQIMVLWFQAYGEARILQRIDIEEYKLPLNLKELDVKQQELEREDQVSKLEPTGWETYEYTHSYENKKY